MSNRVNLSPRDRSLLRLLSWTPATTALLLRASSSFDGEAFADERRLRERLQSLGKAGMTRAWTSANGRGGLQNYYKLTPLGYEMLFGTDPAKPPRSFFVEVSPSLFAHTFRLAETIVEIVRACHARRVTIVRFFRDGEQTFTAGDQQVQPDGFFRFLAAGKPFNVAIEIDNGTEPVDSRAATSIRQKLAVYHAYQDRLLVQWLAAGKTWERPRFRTVFVSRSIIRSQNILALAAETARHPSRRLVYATTHDAFVTDPDPLFSPILLDHRGEWQSLIDLHPTAPHRKTPVRLARLVESPMGV
jgi:hypothetical protein